MRPKRYISNMTALGMSAMAARTQLLSKSPEFDAMSHDELLNDITQFQLDTTRQERLERNIKSAKLPFPSASLETLPVFIKRQIDTHYLNRIAECEWIRNKQNLIVTGLDEKAAAKLASSIARKAIENDFKVKYHDITSLLERFFIYRSEPQTGSKSPIIKLLDELKRPDVLFLRGLGQHPITDLPKADLSRIIQWREGKGGIIVTSPYQPNDWVEMLGNTPDAFQIKDGLTEVSHHFHLARKAVMSDKGDGNDKP